MKGKSKKEERRSRPASRKRIDSHAVKWIVGGNLDDARHHVRTADFKTLEAALCTMSAIGHTETKTRRNLIEARLRKLDREAAK